MLKITSNPTPDDGDDYFFTKTIRLRNGKILYAATYGLNAFRIKRRKKKDE